MDRDHQTQYAKQKYNEFKGGTVKRYVIVTCGDQRVCSACRAQHGKTYSLEQFQPGVTAPPFCDNCRCRMRASEYSIPGMPQIPVKAIDWDKVDKTITYRDKNGATVTVSREEFFGKNGKRKK